MFLFEEPYLLEEAQRNPSMPAVFPSAHHSKDYLTGFDSISLSFLGNCFYKIKRFRECWALLPGSPVLSPITGRTIFRGSWIGWFSLCVTWNHYPLYFSEPRQESKTPSWPMLWLMTLLLQEARGTLSKDILLLLYGSESTDIYPSASQQTLLSCQDVRLWQICL